jgi:hypothetical protein
LEATLSEGNEDNPSEQSINKVKGLESLDHMATLFALAVGCLGALVADSVVVILVAVCFSE